MPAPPFDEQHVWVVLLEDSWKDRDPREVGKRHVRKPDVTVRRRAFSELYFAAQRLYRGVRPHDIEKARRLLDAEKAIVEAHVSQRLIHVHDAREPALRWLGTQPILEKPAFRRVVETLPEGEGRWRRTSGSTGSPLRFPKDPKMLRAMDAAMWAVYGWHHVRPGDPHARFWGAPRKGLARIRCTITDRVLARRRLSAFEITPERSHRFFRQLRRFGPRYAYGYPTLMNHFVDHCESAGLPGRDLDLRVVISTGEMLTRPVRTRLAEFFGCRVVNEYGCSESGILGFECEAGGLHEVPWAVYLEVGDDDAEGTNDSASGEGTARPALITDLAGSVIPLLRYRLGDRIRPLHDPCGCGRALRRFAVDVGREDSFIRLESGRVIYDAVLAYTVPSWVERFVARQTAIDRLEAKVVVARNSSGSDAAELERIWREALGGGVDVHVELVDAIPYDGSGKLRYFVPLQRNST